MCILDALDSLPRLRISNELMKAILWAVQELGVKDVPSLKRLRATQQALRTHGSIRTREFKSVLGNLFFMNDICDLVAKVCCRHDTVSDILFKMHTRTLQTRLSDLICSFILRSLMVLSLKYGMPRSGFKRIMISLHPCSSTPLLGYISMLTSTHGQVTEPS